MLSTPCRRTTYMYRVLTSRGQTRLVYRYNHGLYVQCCREMVRRPFHYTLPRYKSARALGRKNERRKGTMHVGTNTCMSAYRREKHERVVSVRGSINVLVCGVVED